MHQWANTILPTPHLAPSLFPTEQYYYNVGNAAFKLSLSPNATTQKGFGGERNTRGDIILLNGVNI